MGNCTGNCKCSSVESPLTYTKVRNVKDPQRGTLGSAGIDLFVPNDLTLDNFKGQKVFVRNAELSAMNPDWTGVDKTFFIAPHSSILIPSGLHFSIPEGYALIAYNKSGVAVKKGLDIGASVCDHDYQGEVHISLTNTTNESVGISPGEKIVQFLLIPVDHRGLQSVDSLDELYDEETERGSGGFGSTGTQ